MELQSISMTYIEVDLEGKKEKKVCRNEFNQANVARLQPQICHNQQYSCNIFGTI